MQDTFEPYVCLKQKKKLVGCENHIFEKFQSWCIRIRVSRVMPVWSHHSLVRHPSSGKSKAQHKMQSDMCPPSQVKGAKCLLALKGGHLIIRGSDIHTLLFSLSTHLRQVNTQLSTSWRTMNHDLHIAADMVMYVLQNKVIIALKIQT